MCLSGGLYKDTQLERPTRRTIKQLTVVIAESLIGVVGFSDRNWGEVVSIRVNVYNFVN